MDFACHARLTSPASAPSIGELRPGVHRISYSVLCRRRTHRGVEQRRVAGVQHFLLVKAPDKPTLSLAVCDIYEHQPLLCNGDVYVAKAKVFERRAAALLWMRSWSAQSRCGLGERMLARRSTTGTQWAGCTLPAMKMCPCWGDGRMRSLVAAIGNARTVL